jgi:ribonuclease BN (tRNA processing enzyme)
MPLRLGLFLLLAAVTALAWVATCANRHFESVAEGIEALAPRSFETLTLVVVGSGGAYENHHRRGPCIAVGLGERIVLVDAGRGVAEGLRAAAIPVAQPDTVLLSSLLPENTVGLDDLVLTGWLAPRTRPLRVIGPPGTRALVAGLLAAHRAAIDAEAQVLGIERAGAEIEAVEVGNARTELPGDPRVVAAALGGGPLPALAYRFEAGGRSAVVGGTGWGADALVELARGARLLVHEALHTESLEAAIAAGAPNPDGLRREAGLHTGLGDVGALASRAGVAELVLTRLRPPPFLDHQFTRVVGRSFSGRVWIAEDGDELTP